MSWAEVIKTNTIPWKLILKADVKYVYEPGKDWVGRFVPPNLIKINLSAVKMDVLNPFLRNFPDLVRRHGEDVFDWPNHMIDIEKQVMDIIQDTITHESIHEALVTEIDFPEIITAEIDRTRAYNETDEELEEPLKFGKVRNINEKFWRFSRRRLTELYNKAFQELFVEIALGKSWREALKIFDFYIDYNMQKILKRFEDNWGKIPEANEQLLNIRNTVHESVTKIRQYIHKKEKRLNEEFRRKINEITDREVQRIEQKKHRQSMKTVFGQGGKVKPTSSKYEPTRRKSKRKKKKPKKTNRKWQT